MRGNYSPLWVVGAAVLAIAACDRSTTGRTSDATSRAERDAKAMARADRPAEAPPDADDTGINTRDRAAGTVTPMDQSNEAIDLEVTRQIRAGINENDSLSVDAQNVKVVTEAGVVVLRGPVENAQEKATIVAIANRTAGVSRVDDQLEIAHD